MAERAKRAWPPQDITITVSGRLRYWVSEALFEATKTHVAAEAAERRSRRRYRPTSSIADGLRELAAQISDPAVSIFHLREGSDGAAVSPKRG